MARLKPPPHKHYLLLNERWAMIRLAEYRAYMRRWYANGQEATESDRATESRTRGLDTKSTWNLRAIQREEATVAKAVARAIPAIARAVDAIAHALQRGGRLFYVGRGPVGASQRSMP